MGTHEPMVIFGPEDLSFAIDMCPRRHGSTSGTTIPWNQRYHYTPVRYNLVFFLCVLKTGAPASWDPHKRVSRRAVNSFTLLPVLSSFPAPPSPAPASSCHSNYRSTPPPSLCVCVCVQRWWGGGAGLSDTAAEGGGNFIGPEPNNLISIGPLTPVSPSPPRPPPPPSVWRL